MITLPLEFELHNWRKFTSHKVTITTLPLCIVDENGSGKTSLIAALYSLLSGKPWPGLAYKQLLKNSQQYFGVRMDDDWFVSGTVSPSGRVVTKYVSETGRAHPVMTYLPTDNQWFFLSRTQKISILDTLLIQAYGDEYETPLKSLQKAIKQKSSLLKRYTETQQDDPLLASEYTKIIYETSKVLWDLRDRYFSLVLETIAEFYTWVESDVEFDLKIQRTDGIRRVHTVPNQEYACTDYTSVWHHEKLSQRILYGAQRDDFDFFIRTNSITTTLSRGEMRLFVLFLKYNAMQLHPLKDEIIWLLDDIFNEFDHKREEILLQSVLSKSGTFIATSTKNPQLNITISNLEGIMS
jgi:recombinational DNA repair ATPase RecF